MPRVIGAGPGEPVSDSIRYQLARGVVVVGERGLSFRLETPGLRSNKADFLRDSETAVRRY